MALNIGLSASFDNMWNWRGIPEMLMSQMMRLPAEFSTGVALGMFI
jgi:hypothetical protein